MSLSPQCTLFNTLLDHNLYLCGHLFFRQCSQAKSKELRALIHTGLIWKSFCSYSVQELQLSQRNELGPLWSTCSADSIQQPLSLSMSCPRQGNISLQEKMLPLLILELKLSCLVALCSFPQHAHPGLDNRHSFFP